MARIIFGGGVTDMRGSVGGTVYSRNAAGAYARARVQGVNPATPAQLQQRGLVDFVSSLWQELSPARHQAWALFAAALGSQASKSATPITGQQAFMRLNLTYKMLADRFGIVQSFEYLADPPAAPSQMANVYALDPLQEETGIELVEMVGDDFYQVQAARYRITSLSNPGGGPAPFRVLVEATPPFSAGRTRPSSYASLFRPISLRGLNSTLQDVTDDYNAANPHLITYTGTLGPEQLDGTLLVRGLHAALRLTPILLATGERGVPLEALIRVFIQR